jgi:DNA-binding transcriptional regulator LsrR (DeoR family)
MTRKNETVVQHAARLHNAKLDAEVIAERMGIQLGTVYNYISRARTAGMLEVPTIGGMGQLMRSLRPEVRHWLEAQVPPGGTLTEFIAAIVTDAYYEENYIAYPDTGM